MDVTMNPSQRLLNAIVLQDQLVNPKRIEYLLGKARNFISDACRRDRVDFVTIFNTILCDTEPLWATDPAKAAAISMPICQLLLDGTRLMVVRVERHDVETEIPALSATCDRIGTLLRDLGSLVETIGRIEADGVVDESDDVALMELSSRTGQLVNQIRFIGAALRARRQEARP